MRLGVRVVVYALVGHPSPLPLLLAGQDLGEAMVRVTLHTDGGVRTGGVHGPTGGSTGPAAIGFVITNEDGTILRKGGMHIGEATVQEVEYSALIAGLHNAILLGATEVDVRMDSQLVINQMSGRWAVRAEHLKEYAAEARGEAEKFEKVTYTWVPRTRNMIADRITREILDQEGTNAG